MASIWRAWFTIGRGRPNLRNQFGRFGAGDQLVGGFYEEITDCSEFSSEDSEFVKIANVTSADKDLIDALAVLSLRASRTHAPNWLRTVDDAHETVQEALDPEKVCRALMRDGSPLGWVAAGPAWGRIWELHPLLIDPGHQKRGYGRLLVNDIEQFAIAGGALTMELSTSDTTRATNLSGIDLYEDPLGALRRIDVVNRNAGHSYQFWLKVGYTIVGVLPDAEGPDMPSITLSKRLVR